MLKFSGGSISVLMWQESFARIEGLREATDSDVASVAYGSAFLEGCVAGAAVFEDDSGVARVLLEEDLREDGIASAETLAKDLEEIR